MAQPVRTRYSPILQELDHLTNSFGQLKQAQAKFRSCMSDIDELTPATTGTSTLYLSAVLFLTLVQTRRCSSRSPRRCTSPATWAT